MYPKFNGRTYKELSLSAGIPRGRSFRREHETKVAMLARCSQKRRTVKRGTVLGNLILNAAEEEVAPCSSEASEEAFDLHLKEVEQRLPKEFSWQKNQGKNWLEPVMDQGDCGSCYAVSTMRMLSARHKIAQNNTQEPPWSITFPLFCNEYTQGCSGGYGFLMSKWSQDVGLVPAECAKYNTAGKCQVTCDVNKLQKRYRASQHRYLGGYYGNATVAEMMEELHARGPIVVSFEPSSDFMYYGGGVFDSGATPMPVDWQQVDHAVLLVGWGEEAGQKYWLVQNSWGTDWGEGGYFRIVRGDNDSGIEGQPEAAEVIADEHSDVLTKFVAQHP
jgi:cathepsin C